jgi:hypothetical protein
VPATDDADLLSAILADVARLSPAVDLVARTGQGSWTVQFGDIEIEIVFSPDDFSLMLFAEIGGANPERRLEIYEAALMCNLLWRETGGIRVALNGERELVLMLGFSADGLAAGPFAAAMQQFAEKAQAFRALVSVVPSTGSPTDAPHEPFRMALMAGIRV